MIGRIEVRGRNQVTLPKSLTKTLAIREGDILEYTIENGKIIITPKTLVPKDQAWYWSKEWQTAEKEVEQEIAEKGHGKDYSADELLEEIKRAQD
ncbi:MAG: AbrB/MazE/SpoVT family DNA-binding domain-containing protein [Negativicutes bacterium]|nr:AbrB/MazE/SpoVT family DNA-binding domain-containing protein [Negativicutes bacterium]